MTAVLEGFRVIDMTHAHVGPSAGAMLADLGADVIHVEERLHGDIMRGLVRAKGVSLIHECGRHYCFEDLNRNKRSLALDLKKPQGREILYRLIEKSDVFLSNMRAEALNRLGLDPETVSSHNPRIIYASASFLGHRGKESGRGGIELSQYARAGAMATSGDPDGPPITLTPGMGDRITGIYTAYGVVAALLARERFGTVQQVRTSMLGAMISLESFTIMPTLLGNKEFERHSRNNTANPLYNWYLTKDGRYLALAMLEDERYWPGFCKAMDMAEMENDPKFATTEARAENRLELIALLDRVFPTRTIEEWEVALNRHDLLFDRINRIVDVAEDPQALLNNNIIQYDHPVLGKVKMVGFPVELTETPLTLRRCAPELGEHSEEVLLDVGYSWEEIAKLKEEGVI